VKVLIAGMGEIGQALFKALSPHFEVYAKDLEEINFVKIKVLHICYPHSQDFLPITLDYINTFKPDLVMIHSTVPVGTTKRVCLSLHNILNDNNVVHAPIRGEHKNLEAGIKIYPMLIGIDSERAGEAAEKHLRKAKIHSNIVTPSAASELVKLLSLTQYGVNIEFARYAKKCCDKFEVQYDVFRDYITDENRLLSMVSGNTIARNHQKMVLNPPQGKIGGHCVTPGMEKINDQVPEEFLASLIKANNKLVK